MKIKNLQHNTEIDIPSVSEILKLVADDFSNYKLSVYKGSIVAQMKSDKFNKGINSLNAADFLQNVNAEYNTRLQVPTNVGSHVHRIIDSHLSAHALKEIPPVSIESTLATFAESEYVKNQIRNALIAFNSFLSSGKPKKYLAGEYPVWTEKYGGVFDVLMSDGTDAFLLDFKTVGKLGDELTAKQKMQLAVYAAAFKSVAEKEEGEYQIRYFGNNEISFKVSASLSQAILSVYKFENTGIVQLDKSTGNFKLLTLSEKDVIIALDMFDKYYEIYQILKGSKV